MTPALSFEALYGSHNYKLNRPESDVDMMYYYNPSFTDMYNGKMAENNIRDKSTDRKHHDVRKLPQLFYKANVNFLEILYSCQVVKHDGLYDKLVAVREDITSMNIPYLFDGCMGMYSRNYQNVQRDTFYVTKEDILDSAHRVKIGKHASGAFRITNFMKRYANQGFVDFGKAIAYDPGIVQDKVFIDTYMAMRNGDFSYSELDALLKQGEIEANELKGYFKEQKLKEDVNRYVMETVENHVKEQLSIEMCLDIKRKGD
ncbi:nucleotidyltransferase domain-containing protein (plasmid) [Brevibacillus halotolerans]|nr:nucleotidyltransferase domain-containing protein [Brevibacillus halotolerans]